MKRLASEDSLEKLFQTTKKGKKKRSAWRRGAQTIVTEITSTSVWDRQVWESIFEG
jgi:hypothetical protein